MAIRASTPHGRVGRGDRYTGMPWATRSPVVPQQGMAATELPDASQIAIGTLRKGGSAVDAAIAANACLGLMGGDMLPQGQVQVLVNIIDFGMNIQEAGDAARWRHFGGSEVTGEPAKGVGIVEMESGFEPAVKSELEARGFSIAPGASFGGYQAIEWDAKHGVHRGVSEMRKDGQAIGF